MMDTMRGAVAKWVMRILAFFLIVSFAIWGIGDMFRGRGVSQTVATVGDTEIPRQDLNEQFRRVLNTMRERFGANFDRQHALQLGLLDQTLDQIVNGRLLLVEAREMGLRVSDDLVRTAIRSAPEFRGANGAFDPVRFRDVVQREGVGESGYADILRQDILRRQLVGALTAGVEPPEKLVEAIYGYRNEQRVAELVTIPPGDPKSVAEPSPEQLAEFHKKNPGLFTAPEYRQLVVLHLDPAVAAAEIEPPEPRLREEFEVRKAGLSVPERRELQQLLFQDEATARKVSAAVKEGRSYEKAAEDAAQTKPTSLGRLRKEDLPPRLADAVFALPKDGVSEPIQTPLGWHVVRVVSIDPGKEATFDEARKQIRDDLARDMAVDALTKMTNRIDDAMAGGASLEDAAATLNVKPLTIDKVDASGNGPDGKPVPGLPKDARFLTVAFATPAGEVTTIEETADGGFFVLRVEKVIPPAVKPLDLVRDQATAAWKAQQLMDAARATAEAVRDDAKATGSPAKAAGKHGLKAVTSAPFSRVARDPSSPVPDALAAELFKLKEGGIAMAETGDGYAVGQLESIVPADPEKGKEQMKALEDQLRAALADDLLQEYLAALKQRHPVTINREAVEAISATGG